MSDRGLLWAVGLSRRQNVYPVDVALIFPVAKTGKRRQYHIPERPPVSADVMLAGETWQTMSWRRGTRGRLTCRFAARRVRIADGHKHRMLDNRMQCMPGDEVWLVGERRSTGEQKYYVSNLPIDTPLKKLAAEARRHDQSKVGLRAAEGRTRPRPFRRPILDRITSTCLDDDDRLRVSPVPPPQGSGAEKKGSVGRRHSPVCRPSGKPYSTSSHDRRP